MDNVGIDLDILDRSLVYYIWYKGYDYRTDWVLYWDDEEEGWWGIPGSGRHPSPSKVNDHNTLDLKNLRPNYSLISRKNASIHRWVNGPTRTMEIPVLEEA